MNATHTVRVFLLGILAFAVALLGQFLLKGPLKNFSWILYLNAVIVFVYLFRQRSIAHISLRAPDLAEQPADLGNIRFGLLGFSILLILISLVLFNLAYNPLAWLVHLLSIGFFIAAFIQVPKFKLNIPAISLILLLGILLLAGIVRFWGLDEFPFGTWYDEADNGNYAVQMWQDRSYRPVYIESTNLPAHFIYLISLSFRWFGVSTSSMRFVTAAFGVVATLFAYLLFRRWFNEHIGLIAAFFFAIMRYELTFSRIAMHGITTPAFELAALYFLDRALERRQAADFAWLGLVMGFGLAFYTPFRLFPLIVLLFLLLIAALNAWRQRTLHKGTPEPSSWDWSHAPRWKLQFLIQLGILLIAMFVAISPVIQFAVKYPEVFTARTSTVSIFQKRDEPNLGKALWSNTLKHMLMFNVQGDHNGRHNLPGEPMLDPVMGALFVLGLGYALWRWRDPPNLLMLLIFFCMNLGGILSLDFEAPQSLRSIGVMPALVYFAILPVALVTDEFVRALRPFDGKRGLSIENSTIQAGIPEVTRLASLSLSIIGVLAFIAYLNLNTYFNKQEGSPAVWAEHSTAETLVSQEMNRLAGDHDFLLSAMYDNHPTLRFLAGNIRNYQRWTVSDRLPLVRGDTDRGVAMLFDETLLSSYNAAKRYYPNAQFIEHQAPHGGGTVMYEVILTPEDLRAVSGVTAQYFSNGAVEGPPLKEETLSRASVDWTESQPFSGAFTVDLQSTLYAPEYGSYQFSVRGIPNARLWINEFSVNHEPIVLARGNHQLRLQIPGGKKKVELWWQPPGTTQQEPIPGAFLFRPPVTNHGLLGAYYPSPDWGGDPAFTQIDPEIAFYFHIIPLPRPYTVEWTGKIFAPARGDYHFALNSVDGSQLILNDQVVVDNPNGHAMVEGVTSLTEGWHDITVRFSDQTSATQIYLYWMPPGAGQLELVPTYNLLPPMGKYPTPSDMKH